MIDAMLKSFGVAFLLQLVSPSLFGGKFDVVDVVDHHVGNIVGNNDVVGNIGGNIVGNTIDDVVLNDVWSRGSSVQGSVHAFQLEVAMFGEQDSTQNFDVVQDAQVLPTEAAFDAKQAPTLTQVIINMFPTNPINAMAEGNMLQVIVFALLFGIAMALSGEAGKRVASVFDDLNTVILKLVTLLMNLAPYGVFCLMAKLFTTIEMGLIVGLAKYFFTVLIALFIHALVNYTLLLKFLTGLNPLTFLVKMKDACLFAFSTSSSSATMPVTLETATKKLGAHNSVASFTVPLGATINMDGTAIMQGVATVFIAQVFSVDLTISDYLMVILTATLASVGTAGVPGVGLIMLAMVLNQVGLPVEGIAIIMGVDRLLDMTRTAVNVTGDCMVTCVVAKSENEFDHHVFNETNHSEVVSK